MPINCELQMLTLTFLDIYIPPLNWYIMRDAVCFKDYGHIIRAGQLMRRFPPAINVNKNVKKISKRL